MTAKRTWQKHEQYWAELHGENRSGPLGKDDPDITLDNLPIGIECKLQKRRTLRTIDLEQAKSNALKHGRPWLLVLHEKGSDRTEDLVVMDHDTYLMLATGYLNVATCMSDDACDFAIDAVRTYPHLNR